MFLSLRSIALIAGLALSFNAFAIVQLSPVRDLQCPARAKDCRDFDAVVFVHGIYGSSSTFTNATTGFDWPKNIPSQVSGRSVDVFHLSYETALATWATGNNPRFDALALEVLKSMKPLRQRQYRSIGFVAHSLGGNVVTTYIHLVKTRLGHARRSQHAYVITLATPVLGSSIADVALLLKATLGMSDPLLESLRANNLYLEMLQVFRVAEGEKTLDFGCRPLNLHAAYEGLPSGLVKIVHPWSAAIPVGTISASNVQEFDLNHSEIAKPEGRDSPVFVWVQTRMEMEFERLSGWSSRWAKLPHHRKLCAEEKYKPEK